MSITVKNDRALKALDNLANIGQALPQIATKTQGEALGMAIMAARANIYQTTPGAYERTGDYLRSLHAHAQASKRRVVVRVYSESEYARYIEFGRQGTDAQSLQARALMVKTNKPLTIGRTGRMWWLAGPVLTSVQVFAARRMRELLLERAQKI